MEIEADSPTKAGEWEVDFSIIQLVETSADFRRWLVTQATPQFEIEGYMGGPSIRATLEKGNQTSNSGSARPQGNATLC